MIQDTHQTSPRAAPKNTQEECTRVTARHPGRPSGEVNGEIGTGGRSERAKAISGETPEIYGRTPWQHMSIFIKAPTPTRPLPDKCYNPAREVLQQNSSSRKGFATSCRRAYPLEIPCVSVELLLYAAPHAGTLRNPPSNDTYKQFFGDVPRETTRALQT